MSKREETIRAVWKAIDPSQTGIARKCAEEAERAIRQMPVGTFVDEIKS